MRVDFEIGAFKFMYIGEKDDADKALELFQKMTERIGTVLPNEIIQALVAADPKVIEAMKDAAIRDFARQFDDKVVKPIARKLKRGQPTGEPAGTAVK